MKRKHGTHRAPVPSRDGKRHRNLDRLLALLEKTNAVPWEADAKTWQFTYVGPQAKRLLGYPVREWYRKDFWIRHVHAQDRKYVTDFCHTASQSRLNYDFEYRMIGSNKRTVWLHDIVTVERADGVPNKLRGFMIDVTARKQAEADSKKHRDNLEALVQEQTTSVIKTHQQLTALFAVTSTVNASLDTNTVLQRVIETITEIFKFDATRIFLLDPETRRSQLRASFETRPSFWTGVSFFEYGQGIIGRVAKSGKPIIFTRARKDHRYQKWSQTKLLFQREHDFFAAWPITSKLGTLGTLACVGKEPRRLSQSEAQLLSAMAAQIGTAVVNLRLFDQTKEKAKELSLLLTIATQLNTSLNLPAALRRIMHKILWAFNFDAARVLMLGKGDTTLRVVAQVGYPRTLFGSRRKPISEISREVFRTGQPLLFEDIEGNSRYDQLAGAGIMRKAGFRGGFFIPIRLKDVTVGVMNFLSKRSHAFTSNELLIICSVSDQLGIALENFTLFEQTKEQADTLEKDVVALREAQKAITQANKELQALTQRIQVAREEERSRIARQVHDDLGQPLAVVKMELASIAFNSTGQGATNVAQRDWVLDLTDTIIESVQRIGSELRPAILDELGICEAIKWEGRTFAGRTGIAVRCNGTWQDLQLTPQHNIEILRVFQEMLANVYRHAQATRVTVNLKQARGSKALVVADNGRGITQEEIHSSTSFGLIGMRERAHSCGGALAIARNRTGGTTVALRLRGI